MRKVISKRFPKFKHDILFEFVVNEKTPEAEKAILRQRNPELKNFQVCFAYAMINGERKRIDFGAKWPVLPYYSGAVKKLSDNDLAFSKWKKAAFEIVASRVEDFALLVEQEATEEHNFNDLEEIREEFIPWQLEQIAKTGNVEEGAVATLQTEEGQKFLSGEKISNKLKKDIRKQTEHKDKLLKKHIEQTKVERNGNEKSN